MVTAESVKAKLQGLIATANATTGNADADITTAVNALVAGFGQGGGGEDAIRSLVEGTFAGAFVDDTITTIRKSAFNSCKGLTSVSCQNVISIGDSAFAGCAYDSSSYEDGLQEVNFPSATTVEGYAFSGCWSLRCVNMPVLKTIGTQTFLNIYNLTELNLPELTAVAAGGIRGCTALASVNLPKVTQVDGTAFYGDKALTVIDFPLLARIAAQAFASCSALSTLILRSETVCTLDNTNGFNNTPFASNGSGGTVYVPAALVESYKTATNWSTLYAAGKCNFAAIEGSEYE